MQLVITEGSLKGHHVLVVQSVAPKKNPKVFRFLDLPAEIRTIIYGHLFNETGEIRIDSHKPPRQPRRAVRSTFRTGYRCGSRAKENLKWDRVNGKWLGQKPSALTILGVNKLIFQEAGAIMYGDNTFTFTRASEAQIFLGGIGHMRTLLRTVRFRGIVGMKDMASVFNKLKDAKQLRTIEIAHESLCGAYYYGSRYPRPRVDGHDAQALCQALGPLTKVLHKAQTNGESSHNVLDVINVYSERGVGRCYDCGVGRPCVRKGRTRCQTECDNADAHLTEIMQECKTRIAKLLRIEL